MRAREEEKKEQSKTHPTESSSLLSFLFLCHSVRQIAMFVPGEKR